MKVLPSFRFLQERIQLSGEPLTEEEANELISKTNGFTTDAKYSAKYTAVGQTIHTSVQKSLGLQLRVLKLK